MALRDVRKQRDIVLVDQRGTGKLSPLVCRDGERQGAGAARGRRGRRRGRSPTFAGALRAGAGGKADPRFYTTTRGRSRDLDAVRAALGVDADQPGRRLLRHARRAAVRRALSRSTRARSCSTASRRTTLVRRRRVRAHLRSARSTCSSRSARSCRAAASASRSDLRAQLRALKARLAGSAGRSGVPRSRHRRGASSDTLTADTVVGLAHLFAYMPQMASLLPLVMDEADQRPLRRR